MGSENVHLDAFPYTVWKDGDRLTMLDPFRTVDDFKKFAEFLYCSKVADSTCYDPATVLEERGGRLVVNEDLLAERHQDSRRWFVMMESFWWEVLDAYGDMARKLGLGTLSSYIFGVMTLSRAVRLHEMIELGRAGSVPPADDYTEEVITRAVADVARRLLS